MPQSRDNADLQTLTVDLRSLRMDLQRRPFVTGLEVLGAPLESVYATREHRYRRLDEFTFFHVMNHKALQPYRLRHERADLVCIQITLTGAYTRLTPDRAHEVLSATTHITNYPDSTSITRAGQRLRGLWIACDRQHFLDCYGLQAARLPDQYVPLFRSASGQSNSIDLPTLSSNIVAVEQMLSCRLEEPLTGMYLGAKVVEIMCNVVAQMNRMRWASSRYPMVPAHDRGGAIEAAASIYRREVGKPPTIDDLAFRVGLNRNELTAGFKEYFGATPHAYGLSLRMKQAQELLTSGGLSISEVARRVGYSGYASFTRAYVDYYQRPLSSGK